jgi:hypothetical protein
MTSEVGCRFRRYASSPFSRKLEERKKRCTPLTQFRVERPRPYPAGMVDAAMWALRRSTRCRPVLPNPLPSAASSTEWVLPGCSSLSVAPLKHGSIVGSTCLRHPEIGRSRQTSRGRGAGRKSADHDLQLEPDAPHGTLCTPSDTVVAYTDREIASDRLLTFGTHQPHRHARGGTVRRLRIGWIGAVRPSRHLLHSFLRMRGFLNPLKDFLMLRSAEGRVSKHAYPRCSQFPDSHGEAGIQSGRPSACTPGPPLLRYGIHTCPTVPQAQADASAKPCPPRIAGKQALSIDKLQFI